MSFSGCDYKIIRFILLENFPHCLNVLWSVTPITFGVYISQFNIFFFSSQDISDAKGDFSSYKTFSAAFRLVVEKDAVGNKHAVTFTVNSRDLKTIKLGCSVWAFWLKWRQFILGSFFGVAGIEFGSGCLINF